MRDPFGLAVAFVGGAIIVAACVPLRDHALLALHESRTIGNKFAGELHERCTIGYEAAKTREDVAELDATCLPARAALNDYRDAWASLMASTEHDASDGELRTGIVRLHECEAVLRWPTP